ncbi:type A chloramphenicol O-acetyltransferase, partial [Enterococcus faecalis]|nr:type A chloramphenicol O-acetyltransferase [Enterococcus faecalis]
KEKEEKRGKKRREEKKIPISMSRWIDFSSFNLNIGNNSSFLLPIITIGKFYSENNKIYIPVALQLHHSVCDGYHASLFMNEFQDIIHRVDDWI